MHEISALEEAWKVNPAATLDTLDVDGGEGDDGPLPVALHYEDGYQHQRVFSPLVKLEADYNCSLKENQVCVDRVFDCVLTAF